MKTLKLGKLKIDEKSRCIIIAEIGVDHLGNIDRAKKMIISAKECGADIAKFQLHLPTEMAEGHNALKFHGGSLWDVTKNSHLIPEKHKELKKFCEEIEIEYLCTPFCPASVDLLNNIVGVSAFKTGSGEVTNLPQHRKLAKISAETGKPVLVSTGMCTLEEVEDTVSVYEEEKALQNLILMVCTSEYPLENYNDISLRLIPKWREKFNVWTGYSDHSKDNNIVCSAVALGAKIIEKHFTLNYNDGGCDDSVALDAKAFKEMVKSIRNTESALGSEKNLKDKEKVTRKWAFHSVVSDRPIKKGEAITLDNVRPARPGIGIPSKYLDKKYSKELLGKIIKKNIKKDYVLKWNDLEK